MENCPTKDDIIKTFERLKPSYAEEISMEHYELNCLSKMEIPDKNHIYLITLDSHYFIAFYSTKKSKFFIADGTNQAYDNETIRQIFSRVTKNSELAFLKYIQQVKVNFCASSAVAIAVQMTRYDHFGIIDQLLEIGSSSRIWKEYLPKLFDDKLIESANIKKKWIPINERFLLLHCHKCGKSARGYKNHVKLFAHISMCKSRKLKQL